MTHLRSITNNLDPENTPLSFPFNLPVIQTLENLEFPTPVTLFVGENGSGKSTLLEAIACAVGSITIGSESVKTDLTLESVRQLSRHFRLIWEKRTHKGFFLRAEDFFGYAKRISQMKAELNRDLKTVDREYVQRSEYASDLAKMSFRRELHSLEQRYGKGLDVRSHGESFLQLFQSRFVPGGLYLLDEPEAPLSPISQLGFISMLKQMIAENAQFIIATHSPIILAFPGATILNFDTLPIQTVEYHDLEHVTLMKDFLNNPQSFLMRL
ncbi:MAG: AAA family ATPase [Anaerolineaceae bacterium]|nr:AAA family ATPase [Anaerolineaceae bacterium]